MAATKIQLTGGIFQDADGTVLANGYLILELSQDAKVIDSNTAVCSGVKIKVPLNSSGSIVNTSNAKYYAWPNDSLLPVNTFYTVTGYTVAGQIAWGPNTQQILGSTAFDVGTWIPNQLTWWTPSLIPLVLETNNVLNIDPILLNLVNGTNITITDLGAGAVRVSVTGLPYDVGIPMEGQPGASESIKYTFPRTVTFPANFAGSYAECAVAATSTTVFTVKKNTASVGTVTFASSGTTGVFASSGGTSVTFVAGDLFELVTPASPDATWSDGGFTFAGSR